MKLLITRPKQTNKFDYYEENLLAAGLHNEGIYIGKPWSRTNPTGFTLEWNPMGSFYDLRMLPHLGNGPNAQRKHWDEVEAWLKSEDYVYRKSFDHWAWIQHVYIPGIRFWIYPKTEVE